MKTSPPAPTYSGLSLVEMRLVVVTVRVLVVPICTSSLIWMPALISNLLSVSTDVATSPPIAVPVMTTFLSPNLLLVTTSLLLMICPPRMMVVVVLCPSSMYALEPVPAGSRSIIETSSGPEVTKLLPEVSSPRMIPWNPLPSQLSVVPSMSYVAVIVRV